MFLFKTKIKKLNSEKNLLYFKRALLIIDGIIKKYIHIHIQVYTYICIYELLGRN